jgi:TRAP-type mannitol/chloroaromatic compound transport system permease large subunit
MEMAFLTPPVGFNLFYIKGVAPEGVTMHDIYSSVTPFVLLQATALGIIMILPDSVLWLPKLLLR